MLTASSEYWRPNGRRSEPPTSPMSAWTALLWLNGIGVLVAIVRFRSCLTMFLLNQFLVARALGNIEAYGQPISQSYLPGGIFSAANTRLAFALIACTSTIAVFFAVLPAWALSKRPSTPASLPSVPWPILVAAGLYLALFAMSSETILSSPYGGDGTLLGIHLGGGELILVYAVVLYEMYRRVAVARLAPIRALLLLLAMCVATEYLKGRTGIASGLMIGGTLLFLRPRGPSVRRVLLIVSVIGAIGVAGAATRAIRSQFSSIGSDAITSFSSSLGASERDESIAQTGQGAEAYGNGTQYAAHVLECIQLWESGTSREWRSIYLPLEYTFEPNILSGIFSFERSKEAAWELADYYIHGGGVYVVGEFYWNGGWACVLVMTTALCAFMFLCDTRCHNGGFWALMVCAFSPGLYMGIGYGFAQVSRGMFNGIWFVVGMALLSRWRRARRVGAGTVEQDTGPRHAAVPVEG